MKNIFKYLGKTILFFLKQILQAILIIGFIIAIAVGIGTLTMTKFAKKDILIADKTYLELDLSNGVVEKHNDNSLLELKKPTKLYDLLEGIKYASTDPKIEGIFMDLDNVYLSSSHIEEIGEALDNFKKTDKKVYAFTRVLYNQNYKLGLYADKLVMPPIHSAIININGYYKEFNYFKGLADYIGIKFNVVHVGDYKAYGEQYSKESMSKEFKSNIERIYNTIYDERIDEIAKRKDLDKFNINKAILDGEWTMTDPIYGKQIGIIDELSYSTDFDEKYKIENTVSLGDYLTTIKVEKKEDKIAVIYATGNIIYGNMGSTKNTVDIETMKKQLEKAENDKSVKGIVLRVNSPGGSALTSEIIHHEISKLTKPVYVSMGEVAASGGYYISSGADKIFATKSTVTGSIGVVSIIPEISELLDKTMINVETVQKGELSGMYSLTTKITPDEMEKIRISSLSVYNEFKDRVSKGRNIPLNELEEISGGRIWLGEEAKENKLVDEIGGLDTTIKALATHLKLNDYQVIEIVKKKNMYEILIGYTGTYSKVRSFINEPLKATTEFEVKTPLLLMPFDLN